MKMIYLTLLSLCLFTTVACTHSDRHHGHVGNGMAGQTVGSSFPRHLGAGAFDTHGSHDH